jgi:hypothetical protein
MIASNQKKCTVTFFSKGGETSPIDAVVNIYAHTINVSIQSESPFVVACITEEETAYGSSEERNRRRQ